MPDIWTLAGEAGKAIDATERTLPELRAEGILPEFATLADDEMTWSVWLKTVEEIEEFVPEIGQRMTLRQNGERYFTGHVTGRVPFFSAGRWGYKITVSGPWFWLKTEPITSEIEDETTVVQERPIYIFDTDSPTNHLISLATFAIERGLPLSLGSIATCSDVPRFSLRWMSIGDALSEVMRLVADGHLYFDHSGEDGTHPALCMQRRAAATSIELTPELLAVPDLELTPRFDLKVSEVKVVHAERETFEALRATSFKASIAGESAGGLPDRQIVVVSGPDAGINLPQDLTDATTVRSELFVENISAALSHWHDLLKAGEADIGGVGVYEESESDTAIGVTTEWPKDPMVLATDSEGEDLDLSDWPYYLTKGEIKDWFEKDGIESIQARVTATVASSVILPTTADGPTPPKWARVMGATASNHFVIHEGVMQVRYVWQAHVSCVVPLVKTLWTEDTLLIRQEDWGWYNPPAGFAEYLLETQNWVPWQGTVPIATDESPPPNAVGSVLNVAEWVPEAADMRAMISRYSVRPSTGQITYTLGPPARHAYRDLVNRFRQTGADNVFWINRPGGGAPSENGILTEDGDTLTTEDGDTLTLE